VEASRGTNQLLDKYSVTVFLGRAVSNDYGFDIPDIGSNTGFNVYIIVLCLENAIYDTGTALN